MKSVLVSRVQELTRKHARLEKHKEEAGGEQAGVAMHEALGDADAAEQEHARQEPHARRQPLQEDVAGNLENNVGDEEHGQAYQSTGSAKKKEGRQA